jgi:hypothetical protein
LPPRAGHGGPFTGKTVLAGLIFASNVELFCDCAAT